MNKHEAKRVAKGLIGAQLAIGNIPELGTTLGSKDRVRLRRALHDLGLRLLREAGIPYGAPSLTPNSIITEVLTAARRER